jgi:Xaa-Pro aminopeptidase
MHLIRLLLALMVAEVLSWAGPSPELYQARRSELRKALPDGITLLFGRTDKDSDDLRSGFYQEPNFYYLTAWREPGAILLLAPLPEDPNVPGYEGKASLPREVLFLPRRNLEGEKWTGRKVGPDDANLRGITGFELVLPAETLGTELRRFLDQYSRLYTLTDRPAAKKLETLAPLHEIASAALAIARLRMKKSQPELELIQRATDVTIDAHRAAWKRAATGLYEYQIASTMTSLYSEQGCERSAYSPIVGSGPNTTVLHYSKNSRRMDHGELLLMDVGAECAGYVTDISRTIPIGGKFNKRQREIYNVVLGAQKAAIAAIKPGMMLGKTAPNSLYKVAYEYINSHGKDRHGQPLGKYFTHGIGHHVGLEVHDASDPAMPLEPGMVITIEPGIYIPDEGIGVRIEDVLLVTEKGSKLLSAALPREPEEIERALAK